MISLNINVKASAYDKIIYFLSHLKDDVFIASSSKISTFNQKKYDTESFFMTLENRNVIIDKDIRIDDIMNEMNNGLS